MPFNFRRYAADPLFLPAFSKWVSEGSLARFIDELVDSLDREGQLGAFYAQYRADGWGRAAYHPAMMLKVLLYGYCNGVLSSRRLAADLERNVELRFLSADQQPNFRTIAEFRRRHLSALQGLFPPVLQRCREAGLVKLNTVATRGRMVKANASRDKNRQREAIEREIAAQQRQIAQLQQDEVARLEPREDHPPAPGAGSDALRTQLRTRQDRLARLEAARARLDERYEKVRQQQQAKADAREQKERRTGKPQRGRKTRDPAQVAAAATVHSVANPTDPDSILAKKRGTYEQAYNCQVAADCQTQVIVAQEVTREHCDAPNFKPMVEQTRANVGTPKVTLADAGYYSEQNAAVETAEMEVLINPRREYKQRFRQAQQRPPRGRIPKTLTTRERLDRKLLTKRGRALFARRGQVEAVFGQMVGRGLRSFAVRGKARVSAEWSLWCTTHNLLKLWRAGWSSA